VANLNAGVTFTVDVTTDVGTPTGREYFLTCNNCILYGDTGPIVSTAIKAAFVGLSITEAGDFKLTAYTAEDEDPVEQGAAFTVSPLAASKLVFSTVIDGTIETAHGAVVTIKDQYDNTVSSTATVTVTATRGVTTGVNSIAAIAGVATFTGILIDTSGAQQLKATENALVGYSNSFTLAAKTFNSIVVSQSNAILQTC
jgi:hypothetical protein